MLSGSACQRFCVLTVGRSGSTSLMNFLSRFDDIALPCKDVVCIDNELLNPESVARYAGEYAARCSQPIRTPNDLIECFYRLHDSAPYAGFKSMPNRHPDLAAFVARQDIRFVTLVREDIPSTCGQFPGGDEYRFLAALRRAPAGALGVRCGAGRSARAGQPGLCAAEQRRPAAHPRCHRAEL